MSTMFVEEREKLAAQLLVALVGMHPEDTRTAEEYALGVTKVAFEIAGVFVKEKYRQRGGYSVE